MRKLKKYAPTKFKAKDSTYDKQAADYAVNFIECLCHTKGTWAGDPFELIDWQEQIVRDIFGIIKPNGYRQFNTAYIEIPKKQGKSELAAAVALLLTCGDGEERAIRNGKGEIIALYPLMPNKMSVDRDENGVLYYTYQKSIEEGKANEVGLVTLSSRDVLHIPGLGFDGLVGYSLIAMAKNAVGLAIATEEYEVKFFANGAAPSGVLKHPGTIKDPTRLRDNWNSTFGGSANSGKVAVLEEGMKYTPISIAPEQAQFLETRKFQINEVARIFRVPPHMVGDLEKSSFSKIEQQSLELVKYTLDPWIIRWEQSLKRSLLNADEKKIYFFKFNVEGLLRGDY